MYLTSKVVVAYLWADLEKSQKIFVPMPTLPLTNKELPLKEQLLLHLIKSSLNNKASLGVTGCIY